MDTNKILLIQPRHIYAPAPNKSKLGHIYMPTSLLAVAAIFDSMGINVKFVDENIETAKLTHELVGINLLGAPYIPSAINLEQKLFKRFGNDFTLLIGGQVVSGLDLNDMNSLFSKNTINGNSYENLSKIFNIPEEKIPRVEKISLQKSYDLIGERYLRLYLLNEFGFYLSQGCKHSCSFCAAERSVLFSELNIKIRKTETYRDISIALDDFEYLLKKAKKFNISKLKIYLSNLDLFQSPINLFFFAEGLTTLRKKYPDISVNIRGLSTARSFLQAHEKFNYVIKEMVKAGLMQVGFGIDGATYRVFKETRKPQSVQECLDVIRIAKEEYKIIPEILMVFGHNDKEDEKALNQAFNFCREMNLKYHAIPRPHIAKDVVPGNDGWLNPKNQNVKKEFYKNPMLFQNLDFTALPSQITHPDAEFRELVSMYYKKVCELPNSLTQYVQAENPNISQRQLNQVKLFNLNKYDI